MGIPEKLTEMINNEHLLLCNALKGAGSGAAVSLYDVSPVEHELGVIVKKKNLLNIDAMLNSYLSKEGDIYTLTKKQSHLSNYFYLSIPANTTITFSGELIEYTGTHVSWLRMEMTYKNGGYAYIGLRNDASATDYKECSTTLKDDVVRVRLYIEGTNAVDSYSKFKNIQLEEGTEATAYAPYIEDISTVKVSKCGKNILDVANAPMYGNHHNFNTKTWTWERTETGVKFTALQDFNMRYARNGYHICPIDMVRGKTITVSFNRIGKVPGEYVYMITAGDNEFTNDYTYLGNDVTNPKTYKSRKYSTLVNGYAECTFTVPADETRKYLYLVIYPAYETDVVAGEVIEYSNIQVEINDTATEYEPYWKDETEYSVDANGVVTGINSTYPTITLITDTAGTVIQCEYNRDINKAYQELYNAILSLGGNV